MNTSEYSGALRIRATTARGALPVPGAQVRVSRMDENGASDGVIASGKTDSSGLTEIFILPAPPKENSEAPDNPTPYSQYNVEITADGYYPVESFGVPIFPGILSTQPADLVPILGGETE